MGVSGSLPKAAAAAPRGAAQRSVGRAEMGPTGGPEVALVKHRALRPHRSRPPGLLLVLTGFSALLAASCAVYATLWLLDFGGRSLPVGLLALWSSRDSW